MGIGEMSCHVKMKLLILKILIQNAWMESLKERKTLTSNGITNGDMGGWVSRILQLGRLVLHPWDGTVDEALQLFLVVVVVHSSVLVLNLNYKYIIYSG